MKVLFLLLITLFIYMLTQLPKNIESFQDAPLSQDVRSWTETSDVRIGSNGTGKYLKLLDILKGDEGSPRSFSITLELIPSSHSNDAVTGSELLSVSVLNEDLDKSTVYVNLISGNPLFNSLVVVDANNRLNVYLELIKEFTNVVINNQPAILYMTGFDPETDSLYNMSNSPVTNTLEGPRTTKIKFISPEHNMFSDNIKVIKQKLMSGMSNNLKSKTNEINKQTNNINQLEKDIRYIEQRVNKVNVGYGHSMKKQLLNKIAPKVYEEEMSYQISQAPFLIGQFTR